MIPRIIHYCWVGSAELNAIGRKCLESWQRFCPDWTITEWNDASLPYEFAYVAKARERGMYSNVSNFIRLYAVWKHGGIYLDADAELIRDPRELLGETCFFGFQSSTLGSECVNNAIFGAVPGHPFVKAMLDRLVSEFSGTEDSHLSGPGLATRMLRREKALPLGTDTDAAAVRLGDITIFPRRYFAPFDWTQQYDPRFIVPDTMVIHWWTVSWTERPPLPRRLVRRMKAAVVNAMSGAGAATRTAIARRLISRRLRGQAPDARAPALARARDEGVTVACLVKNGELSIADFIEHHLNLGVSRIILLDNQSTDRTRAIAQRYDRVSVYSLDHPLWGHESQLEARRYLIERLCRTRWCLWLDADELFDYPASDRVPLDDLIAYLEQHDYSAVVGQMLDMFADGPLNAPPAGDAPLRDRFPYYDVSDVDQWDYATFPGFEDHGNRVSNPRIRFHTGGIRKTVFGTNQWLTKHPLICLDGRLRPAVQQHWVANASCADFSAVLYHYKFLPDFQRRNAASYESGFGSTEDYGRLVAGYRENPAVVLKGPTAQRLEHVDDLLRDGLLVVSDQYRAWANRPMSIAAPTGLTSHVRDLQSGSRK